MGLLIPHTDTRSKLGLSGLALVFGIAVTTIIAWQIVTPLIPLRMDALGASPQAIGFAISGTNILPLLLAMPMGVLSDFCGPSVVALWSAGLYAASLAFLVLSGTLASMVAAVALMGLAHLGLTITTQALTAAHAPAAQLDKSYSHYSFWVAGGMVVGPMIGGFAADIMGYRSAFVFALGFAILSVLGALRFQPLLHRGPDPDSSIPHFVIPTAGRLGKVGVVLFLSFLIGAAFSIRVSFLPIYLHDVGLSIRLIGSIFALQSVASMAVRPLIPFAIVRFGHGVMLTSGVAAAAVATATIPLFTSFVPLAATGALLGVALGFTQPITMSLVTTLTNSSSHGLTISLRLAALRLALVIGPLGFGLAAARFGIGSAFYLAASSLVAGLILLQISPFDRRFTSEA